MRRVDLTQMSNDDLVQRFAEIGVAQDEAIFNDDHAKFNRLFDKMCAVGLELRDRGPKARLELRYLYAHPNLQVRLKAAIWTLAVAPEEARQLLEEIYKSKLYPQAADAGLMLAGLDDGTYKPE